MKTPEEIKRGLECCINSADLYNGCNLCPYNEENFVCFKQLPVDALAYIRQLEREKEAAVADLAVTKNCKVCKYVTGAAREEPCWSCGIAQRNWEWRGVEEDE